MSDIVDPEKPIAVFGFSATLGNSSTKDVPDSITIAKTCAEQAHEIQAEDVVVLDLRGISTLANYFVICTATSIPHMKAVAREIREKTEEVIGERPRSSDGDASSQWTVIDYVDVVVHIFHRDKRDVYSLEDLWSDAPRVPLDFLEEKPATKS